MPFEIVLPHDTQSQIDEFLEAYANPTLLLQANDILEEERNKLAANPTLGATNPGSPFEGRRIHRLAVTVANSLRVAEYLYKIFHNPDRIVISGFQEVTLPPTKP